MARLVTAVSIAAVAAAIAAGPAAAQTVRDDFHRTGLRDRELVSLVAATRTPWRSFPPPGRASMPPNCSSTHVRISRWPPSASATADVAVRPGPDYAPGVYDERAELWEADDRLLKFGTEIWYRFAMYIDPALPNVGRNRLVVGQWKAEGGHSPFIAQRFVNRQFVITIEQDNDDPASDRDDDECRIVIAYTPGFPASMRGEFGESIFQPLPDHAVAPDGARANSIAHDQRDAVNGMWSRLGPCAQDVQVTGRGILPEAVGNWTTMMYHIRAATDGTGLLEIWANGNPVVSVRGRFGFRDGLDGAQYFKFRALSGARGLQHLCAVRQLRPRQSAGRRRIGRARWLVSRRLQVYLRFSDFHAQVVRLRHRAGRKSDAPRITRPHCQCGSRLRTPTPGFGPTAARLGRPDHLGPGRTDGGRAGQRQARHHRDHRGQRRAGPLRLPGVAAVARQLHDRDPRRRL